MKTKCFLISLSLMLLFAQTNAQETSDYNVEALEIPYQQFTLDNGLTLVVHEDHKAPIVAVNVWYHVGSKNEPEGKTGFAHLFEHLMFNGSENYNDDYFQAMERVGATDLNGTTWFDRTNYFQNVPKEALDVALWMESDRMGHFEGAITQERLDEQRDVVKNEKRQGDNQPYGKVRYHIQENSYPEGHPYHHSTIGSMEDLSAASLEDVKEWFNDYYGAANAVLVIAGDVDTEEVHEKVKNYFGDIPPGPPVARQQVNIAKRTGTIRETMKDRVPQTRLHMVWNVPEYGNDETTYLNLASDVLASGKNSRFYKRLVYEEQIASGVSANVEEHEIGSLFKITANVKPEEDKKEVEQAIMEELHKFLEEGPTDKELKRIKTQHFAGFARGTERIGGFGGKSDILARNTVYTGNPDHYMEELKTVKNATAAQLRTTAEKWLSDGMYLLSVEPFPEYTTRESTVDRSKLPEVEPSAEVKFPELERTTLNNGMKIILARRSAVPMVKMNLVLDAGYAADQFGTPGTASLAMNMLDEGTQNLSSLEINEKLQLLGATLNTSSNLDQSKVSMKAMKANFEPSLELFADVILNPAFPEKELGRLKQQTLVSIQQEKNRPFSMALRVFPKIIYGEDHAYGTPLTGSGYESTVKTMTRENLRKFYNTWFKPNNATLVVTGDIAMDTLKTHLNNYFKDWKKEVTPEKNLSEVPYTSQKIYLMDRPGSSQTILIAGHVSPPGGEDEISAKMMNNILGGEFTSRVNMNLREDKGWAYGARTLLWNAKGQQPFLAYAPVQTDKTAESMREIAKELSGYVQDHPPTMEEFEKTKRNEVLSLPGKWETLDAVSSSIENMVRYNYPDNYYQNYADKVQNLTLEQVRAKAKEIVRPGKLTWVVVGDKEKIKEEIEALNFGEIVYIDTKGNILGENKDAQDGLGNKN